MQRYWGTSSVGVVAEMFLRTKRKDKKNSTRLAEATVSVRLVDADAVKAGRRVTAGQLLLQIYWSAF